MRRFSGRILAFSLMLLVLFALPACGSGHTTVCNVQPLSSSSSCGCSGGDSACPATPAHLYATSLNGQIGQIGVFDVNPGTGVLSGPTTTPATALPSGITSIGQQFLYVSGSEAIEAWSIDSSTGVLGSVPGSPFFLGALNNPGGLAADDALQVLYVADSATTIATLQAGSTGVLTPIPGGTLASGVGDLAIDPQNRFLFGSDGDAPGGILAFTINSTSGALTSVPGSPFPAIQNYSGNSSPTAIAVDATGSFVYAVLSATNQVAAFAIASPSGVLTPVPGSPFATGNFPMALATAGNFLYVSYGTQGAIAGYSIRRPGFWHRLRPHPSWLSSGR